MKKVLLFSFIILTTLSVMAYETIIIKYPSNESWIKTYYKKVNLEAILQYSPAGQTHKNWIRTIVIHSYNHSTYPPQTLIRNNVAKMMKINPTANYKYLKFTDNDCIVSRCTEKYKEIPAQCEILRVVNAHDGIISIHYINKDKADFLKHYYQWYEIIKNAIPYNSYYRDDRILDKSEFFEL